MVKLDEGFADKRAILPARCKRKWLRAPATINNCSLAAFLSDDDRPGVVARAIAPLERDRLALNDLFECDCLKVLTGGTALGKS
jgi:hypothetical protein